MTKNLPKIIVIGASAGGLEAVSKIAGMLPADFPAPILYVAHLMKGRQSEAAAILGHRTVLKVRAVKDGERLEPGCLFVAQSADNISVQKGWLHISKTAAKTRLAPSIDVALTSAAQAYGSGVLAILLTGRLDDGVSGLNEIHRVGGTTLIQDPAEAAYNSMPLAAIARDHPNQILTLERIGEHLLGLVQA